MIIVGAIVFEQLGFPSIQKQKVSVINFPGLKRAFEKVRFGEGLVWTVGLTVEIKLRFLDGLVWTVGLIVEI